MLGEFLITSEHEQKIGLMSDSGNEYWEKESSLFGRIWYKLSTNLSLPLSVEAVHLLLDSAQQLCSILQIMIVSDSNL